MFNKYATKTNIKKENGKKAYNNKGAKRMKKIENLKLAI